MDSPGKRLRTALSQEKPLQLPGVINAYAARLADKVGFRAMYLSGAGVANANYALPDLGLTSLNDVLEQVQHICEASALPMIVDADTGWGGSLNISRTFKLLNRAGAAGAHIEDQTEAKRCGHREGKQLVTTSEMVGRIKAAVDGRENADFMVVARTDAIAGEGIQTAIERAVAYQNAGADVIFIEAVTELQQYQSFRSALTIPILANLTEFGKTPLFSLSELSSVGVDLAIYPLSAFRAMNAAALKVFKTIREKGSQASVIDMMQTRDELYEFLDYVKYEELQNK